MLRKLPAILCALLMMTSMHALGNTREIKLSGKTMGTTYHITIISDPEKADRNLQKQIDQKLDSINQSMSTYRPDSEISRFNALREADQKFEISESFREVLMVSQTVYQLTEGAWDGTVMPLVKLWGFMSEKLPTTIPDQKDIERILLNIGFDKIVISNENYILKKDPHITLDLGSIAKGFGVDRVSELLIQEGFNNFIVEIGGEIYASGTNLEGNPWRVGINTPDKNAPADKVHKIITLSDLAMATSGDYRNLIEIDGQRYSHIINPKTGYPVQNQVVSATIIAQTCTFADGLATAVLVMELEKSLELINRLTNVEGYIIVRSVDGAFSDHYSNGFIP